MNWLFSFAPTSVLIQFGTWPDDHVNVFALDEFGDVCGTGVALARMDGDADVPAIGDQLRRLLMQTARRRIELL